MIRSDRLVVACFRLVVPAFLVLGHTGCDSTETSPSAGAKNENVLPDEFSPAGSITNDADGNAVFMPFDDAAPIEESRFVEPKHVGSVEEDNVQFAPDGIKAYAAEEHIGIYDVTNWRRTDKWTFPDVKEFEHLKLSRDGRILAAAHADGMISVWDTSTGECVQRFTHPPSADFMGGIFRIPETFAVSSDGQWIASGEGGTFESFVWEARTGKVLWKWTTSWRDIKPADFNPAGDTLAAMGKDRLDFRDVATGENKHNVRFGYKDSLDLMCYSPDGQHLLAACNEEINGEERSVIVLFAADTGNIVWKIETALPNIYSIAYSPNGTTIAVTGELPRIVGSPEDRRAVQIRNAKEGTIRFTFEANSMPFLANTAFSPNGKLLATGHELWELPTE